VDISINSFPRSGTQFLKFNLDNMIGKESVAKCPPSLIEIKKDRSCFQVVVVRNPKDNAISCVAHSEYQRTGSGRAVRSAIVHTLREYCNTIDYFLENIEYINLYDFNHLEWALADIADRVKIDVSATYMMASKFYSVADTLFYQQLLHSDMDDSLFEEANEKYQAIIGLCRRPAG
jgi:hypothetical protein